MGRPCGCVMRFIYPELKRCFLGILYQIFQIYIWKTTVSELCVWINGKWTGGCMNASVLQVCLDKLKMGKVVVQLYWCTGVTMCLKMDRCSYVAYALVLQMCMAELKMGRWLYVCNLCVYELMMGEC